MAFATPASTSERIFRRAGGNFEGTCVVLRRTWYNGWRHQYRHQGGRRSELLLWRDDVRDRPDAHRQARADDLVCIHGVALDPSCQEGGVPGRDVTTDDRSGAFVAVKLTPIDAFKIAPRTTSTRICAAFPTLGCPTIARAQRLPEPRSRMSAFRARIFTASPTATSRLAQHHGTGGFSACRRRRR
jgi:hypothetical protein